MVWVFGYGSLVWRPAFPHLRRLPAYVEGFKRRFYQGSPDHRGVAGAPGRVVTLLPQEGARTWGLAYEVAAADEAAVLARLDHREKGGYARHRVTLHLRDLPPVEGLVYVATVDNPQYLGPAPLEDIADQVRSSVGPSGSNVEYVLQLARALDEMGAPDPHVTKLARLLGARW